jgi:hypothetical protein
MTREMCPKHRLSGSMNVKKVPTDDVDVDNQINGIYERAQCTSTLWIPFKSALLAFVLTEFSVVAVLVTWTSLE